VRRADRRSLTGLEPWLAGPVDDAGSDEAEHRVLEAAEQPPAALLAPPASTTRLDAIVAEPGGARDLRAGNAVLRPHRIAPVRVPAGTAQGAR